MAIAIGAVVEEPAEDWPGSRDSNQQEGDPVMPEYELVITFEAADDATASDVGRATIEAVDRSDSGRLLGEFRFRTQLGQSFPFYDEPKLSQSIRTRAYAVRKLLEQLNALPDLQGQDAADLARRVLANARDLAGQYEP